MGVVERYIEAMRERASIHAVADAADALRMTARAQMVRFDPAPLPQHVSKRRRRLRQQQAQFAANWRRHCDTCAAMHHKAALMHAEIAKGTANV